ncbi:MAG: lysozyme inhibitor LprI family protein [Bacteroidia bacterium]
MAELTNKIVLMEFKTTLILLTLTIFFNFAYSQDKKHTIDIELEHCLSLDSNMTTSDMMNCAIITRDAWEKEMNKYFELLLSILTSEQQNQLNLSQQKWIEFKEEEFELSNKIYNEIEGTMWRLVAIDNQSNIFKKRAIELISYYENLTFE